MYCACVVVLFEPTDLLKAIKTLQSSAHTVVTLTTPNFNELRAMAEFITGKQYTSIGNGLDVITRKPYTIIGHDLDVITRKHYTSIGNGLDVITRKPYTRIGNDVDVINRKHYTTVISIENGVVLTLNGLLHIDYL
ncbi:hypothetical protein DPMN_155953 [Dreissena polymorpha]|uniref:Uncharacterized protein n=1 Tax=Dreissena polymorpha TaxID=45954 RepID=A0A9D4J8C2_DREPO|nr:hypothetical protein DPMN_155953 [Dreissena polymorpha]